MSTVDRELRKGRLPDLTPAQEKCLLSASRVTQTMGDEEPETFYEVRAGLDQRANWRTLMSLHVKGLVSDPQTFGRSLHIARLTDEGRRVYNLLGGEF